MRREEAERIFSEFLHKYEGKRLAVTTHGKADADGLASAYALSKALPGSVMCTSEDMNESARQLAAALGIETVLTSSLDKRQFDGMVLVDTSSYVLVPEAKGWKIACVIDHHRPEGRDVEAEFAILDPGSPSAAEIVSWLLKDVDADTAFALSVAIIADGARFKSARAETFGALSELMRKSGRGYQEMLAIAEPEIKEEAKIAVLKAFQRVRITIAGGYIIATSEVGSNESDAAALISEAADVAFVASWKDKEGETRISARARKHVKIPLNEVLGEVGAELGGAGGGHAKAAGASVKAHTEEALKKCVEAFMGRL